MEKAVLDLYSSISSLSPVEGPCACPPEGMAFFLAMVEESSFFSLSISAFCVLMVSLSSESAEDDSLLMVPMVCLSRWLSVRGGDVLLTNAMDVLDTGLRMAVTTTSDEDVNSPPINNSAMQNGRSEASFLVTQKKRNVNFSRDMCWLCAAFPRWSCGQLSVSCVGSAVVG